MKRKYVVLCCILSLNVVTFAQKVVLTGKVQGNFSGGKATAQLYQYDGMSRTLAVQKIPDGIFRLEAEIPKAGFYGFRSLDQSFDLYLRPGDELQLEIGGEIVRISGKGLVAENQFLIDCAGYQEEYYRLPVPDRVAFGKVRAEGAWRSYSGKVEALEKLPLDVGFKVGYKGFLVTEFWRNMIGGLGASDRPIEPEFLKTLKRVKLSAGMVNHGNWYEILETWMSYHLNAGKIRIGSYDTWLKDLASFIKDKRLREDYLVQSIRLEVLRGEFVRLPEQMEAVCKMIRKPENKTEVKKQVELMAEKYSQYVNCMPGTDMSGYAFTDRDNKEVKLGDYEGKYVYIDVWSTGCRPCKLEIPHLARLEKAMAGEDIVFVSLSLDLKREMWIKFLDEKKMEGIQWIAKKGSKHPFCTAMGIQGIPRFIVLDREGKIINFHAKRPSNPILWKYLREIIRK